MDCYVNVMHSLMSTLDRIEIASVIIFIESVIIRTSVTVRQFSSDQVPAKVLTFSSAADVLCVYSAG